MTLAYDRATGRLLGQLTQVRRTMTVPDVHSVHADRLEVLTLLTRSGYLVVPAAQVRLERVQ